MRIPVFRPIDLHMIVSEYVLCIVVSLPRSPFLASALTSLKALSLGISEVGSAGLCG